MSSRPITARIFHEGDLAGFKINALEGIAPPEYIPPVWDSHTRAKNSNARGPSRRHVLSVRRASTNLRPA